MMQSFGERFAVERKLGQGGMGVVYLAHDSERDAPVALKALSKVNPRNVFRFKREFRALSDVAHENLVVLHELVHSQGRWFFTMEYVDGEDLLDHVWLGADPAEQRTWMGPVPGAAAQSLRGLADNPRADAVGAPAPAIARVPGPVVEPERLRQVMAQLARGVRAIHQAGKLHRDLKPGNVRINREGRVVVLDFGMAMELQSNEDDPLDNPFFGTPAYVSPEQAAGRPLSEAADWYSFGVMLYELLTGRLPIEGSALQMVLKKARTHPPPPSAYVSDVPDDLDALCHHLLTPDPQARPDGLEILRRLGDRDEPRPPVLPISGAPGPQQAFVGRVDQLRELETALDNAQRASLCLVYGSSGAGKTALVGRFAEQLRGRSDVLVLQGACHERELLPFKAFDGVVEALTRHLLALPEAEVAALLPADMVSLARVFPVLTQLPSVPAPDSFVSAELEPRALRRRAFAALRALLSTLSAEQRVLLVVDDLQWADEDSARLLLSLLSAPQPPPLMFVGCYRREEAARSPFLSCLRGAGDALGEVEQYDLPLQRLSRQEALQVARAELSGCLRPEALAQWVVDEADGLPFLVHELARFAMAEQSSGRSVADAGGGVGIEAILEQRLSRLDAQSVALLRSASVAARPLSESMLLLSVGASGDSEALHALRASKLLRCQGDRVSVYHDKIREAVVRGLSTPELRRYHNALAEVLSAAPDVEPARMLEHLKGAGRAADAATYAERAADRAASAVAFHRAAELYRQALDLAPQRFGLWEKLGEALAHAGHATEAGRAYLAAAEEVGGEAAHALENRAAEQLLTGGRIEEGTVLLKRVFERVGLNYPATHGAAALGLLQGRLKLLASGAAQPLARLRRRTGVSPSAPVGHGAEASDRVERQLEGLRASLGVLFLVDFLRGAYFATEYLRLARRAGDATHLLHALVMETSAQLLLGRERRAVELCAEVTRLGDALGTPWAKARALGCRATYYGAFAEHGPALSAAREAIAILNDSPRASPWEVAHLLYVKHASLFHAGGVDEMARELPELVREARERNDGFGLSSLST